ncbi:hypothetical protein [Leminorella grimontii]|uniref:hypothetical protein n=1 Tax=Leminorella grimontii TaxID=82981 RepID=UPI0020881BB8|nr:hypothetical protein [Leminorella grimontii]GKX59433.1 hypothetical protein SOASR031_17480 [Leminorella grimontii]
MEKKRLEEINALRARVPVGIRYAQALIEKCDGRIEEAVALFQQELAQQLAEKSALSLEEARGYLRASGYDMARALQAIDHARFTLTERILRKNAKDKGNAVDLIANAIEQEKKLTRNYWLSLENLDDLAPELRCFMTIHEWQNYAGWEGLDSALYFHLEHVTEQLRFIGLGELAQALEQAHHRQLLLQEQHAGKDYIETNGIIQRDVEFAAGCARYDEQEPLIDERLYQLAANHIDLFPA